ncbi:hypothetical protein [Sphingomonas sp.]|uniref:hypothetical protein n=1 Tax=Sphingomonas sp. TaxID=28214 RepID=UPI0025FA90AF|nr:hypothetical protein [Sphingomonas sp.]
MNAGSMMVEHLAPSGVLVWITAALLGIKLLSTVVLLALPRDSWFDSRWTAGLWWASKITPLLAVPCMIVLALKAQQYGWARVFACLMLFVVVAVPVKIWRRSYRGSGTGNRAAG